MIKVGILGAAGYTGGELIRLLVNHPKVEIVFANSESNAGNKVYDVHEGLIGETELEFTSKMPFDKDVIDSYNNFMTAAQQYKNLSEQEMKPFMYDRFGGTFYFEYFFTRDQRSY